MCQLSAVLIVVFCVAAVVAAAVECTHHEQSEHEKLRNARINWTFYIENYDF